MKTPHLFNTRISAARIVLPLVLLILAGEALEEILFVDAPLTQILLKSALLSLIMAPIMFITVIRPIMTINHHRREALEQLNRGHDLLTESERRFRIMSDSSPALIWQSDASGGCTYFNAAWYAFTGRTAEQEMGNGWAEGVHPEDKERCMGIYTRSLDERTPFSMEYRLRKQDGTYGWLMDHGRPIFSPGEEFMGFIGSCIDITSHKEAERSLSESRYRYQSILEGTHVGTWEWNIATGETIFNERWAEIIGYRLEELMPVTIATWQRFLHPDDAADVERKLKEHFNGTSPYYDTECRMRHRNGSWVWIHDRGRVVLRLPDGSPHLMYGTHSDITDRKSTEQALKESNSRIRSMFEKHTAMMLLIHPETGQILDANDAAAGFYGYPLEMLCTMNIDKINTLPPDQVKRSRLEAAAGTENRFRFPHRLASGDVRTVEVNSTKITLGKESFLFSIIHDITEQERIETLLRDSEEKFRDFFEQSNDGITLIDEQGIIIEWNQAMERITGILHGGALGFEFIDIQARLSVNFITEELLQQQKNLLDRALECGESPLFHKMIEAQYRTPQGEVRSVQQMIFPIRTGTGFRIGMISRDNTEKAQSEQVLARTRANYESFFNTIDEFLFVLDTQGNIIYTNRTVKDRLGFTDAELNGLSVLQVHPEQRRAEASRIVGEMLQGTTEYCPVPLQTRAGILIPVETRAKLGTWDDQPVIFGTSKDISRMMLSEEKFSKVFYLNPSACGLSEIANGNYVEVNKAFEELLGYSSAEVIGKSAYDLNILDKTTAEQIIRHADENGRVVNAEAQLRTKDGFLRSVLLSAESIIVQDKRYRFTVVNDITAQKDAQDKAAQLALRNETMLQNSKDGIHVMDERGNLLEVNDAFCTMLGYSRPEALSLNVRDWDAQWSYDTLTELISKFLDQPSVFETQHRRKDGTTIHVEVNAVGVTFEGKRLLYASSRDITERKATEDALRHSQKLESIGTLAGGIAHDFNNLLVAILGQSSLAYEKMRTEDPARQNIEKVIKASEHAADLTKQLLAYSGQGKFFMEELDLNRLILENVQMFELSVPKNCRMTMDLDASAPHIKADKGQIQQVLMNLIINAGEAVGERNGSIKVRTELRTIEEGEMRYSRFTNFPLTGGTYAVITVNDTGAGMSADQLLRIFDPFFTTKFTGRGLGLAAVLGIIRGHQGGIDVASQENDGTMFEILFPLIIPAPSVTNERSSAPRHAEKGTILIIDDEPSVVELVNDVLNDNAFTVLQARNPLEGIELFRNHWQDISLVILDYAMPDLNGRQTFQQLVQINDTVPVLLSSGYSEEHTMELFGTVQPAGFFQKPYTAARLLEKVRSMVGSQS